ncbi:hypothetical protein ACVWYG_001615 [Pedobacter sp. UYEF25]
MNKELIEQIRAQLQEYEEPYDLGAWERFNEKNRKQRRFIYWPLWSAAAVILVFLGLFFTFNQTDKKSAIAVSKPKLEAIGSTQNSINNGSNVSAANGDEGLGNRFKSDNQRVANHYDRSLPSENNVLAQKVPLQNILTSNTILNLNAVPATELSTDLSYEKLEQKQQLPPANHLTFEELLARDSKTDLAKTTHKNLTDPKWESGVYVAPAIGNDNKVNLNYGFSLSYSVAPKISISSGVSYASLSSSETLSNSSPQSLSGKNLGAVNAKVSGINVPLELRYKISDRLYTGVGISALAVLNNSQSNTYLSNEVQSFASPNSVQNSDLKNYIVQEKTVEPQPPASVAPDNYIGFYNFSLGYKQKISKKNNISIEPFLQLPMKTFSKENLNLTNGGVRLKFDF